MYLCLYPFCFFNKETPIFCRDMYFLFFSFLFLHFQFFSRCGDAQAPTRPKTKNIKKTRLPNKCALAHRDSGLSFGGPLLASQVAPALLGMPTLAILPDAVGFLPGDAFFLLGHWPTGRYGPQNKKSRSGYKETTTPERAAKGKKSQPKAAGRHTSADHRLFVPPSAT